MIRNFLTKLFHIHQSTWVERHFTLLLIVAAAVAMAISLGVGLAQSVWFDEAYSIIVAKQDVSQLLHLAALDTHPPAYYLLLKAWTGLFGWGELALRSLSALAMGGALVVGGLLVRRLFGVRVALIALPFIIFAPFLLRYGFEIRMYALASLIGVAATYVLVAALQAKTSRQRWLYALYAVLVALGVYTLYYMALLWIAHVVWLAVVVYRTKKPADIVPWLLTFLGSVVLFLPWLPVFVSQMNNGALAAIAQPLSLENLTGIVSFMFVDQPSWQLAPIMALILVGVIVTVVVLATRAFRQASVTERSYLLLLGLYVLVPVAVLAVVSLARPMYVERYLSHVLIGGSLFVGVVTALALAKKPTKLLYAAASGLIIVMVVGVGQLAIGGNYNFQRLQKPEVKAIAASIGACTHEKTILAADPYIAIELMYYLSDCDVHFTSDTASLRGGYAPLSDSPLRVADPKNELRASNEIVYIYYDEPKLEMPSALHQSTASTYGPVTVATFSAE